MELTDPDIKKAYQHVREQIITLGLTPGAVINEQQLADELDLGVSRIREAIKLLAHDDLVVITPRRGLYVADINLPDLEQLSELRLSLEALSARLAAQRASEDDLTVLDALRQEQAAIDPHDHRRLLDVDHKFHQALVRAAHNKYLERTLEQLFGLSQRLWYVALPRLEFLPTAVAKHLEIVEAIQRRDADRAEEIMSSHVKDFYDRVREVLQDRA